MNIIDIFILGILQGITEFLPVSSSGHLALLPHLMNFQDPGLFFDLAMHIGTALAIMVYFRKELLLILLSFSKASIARLIDLYSHPIVY